MKRLLLALTATALTVGGATVAVPALADTTPTPAPTAATTASPTPSASASATATATPAPTSTATPAPTATATPAPAPTAAIALTNAPSGSASNLTAALTGVPAGTAVVLQRAKGSSTHFVDLATAVSDAKGSVTFSGVHSYHSQLFRVAAGSVVSNTVAVKQYGLSPVTLSLQVVRSGDYVRTSGTASYTSIWFDSGAQFVDTIAGHRVHLQRWTTKWKDADIIRSSASGALDDKVKYPTTSMFRFASVATSTYEVAASVSVVK